MHVVVVYHVQEGNVQHTFISCSMYTYVHMQVYQHVSGNSFPLHFQLELGANGVVEPVHHIIHLFELNNRTDFAIEGAYTDLSREARGPTGWCQTHSQLFGVQY